MRLHAVPLAGALVCAGSSRHAQERAATDTAGQVVAAVQLDKVEVTGRHYDNAIGSSDAASQGVIRAELLKSRTALRPGEVLEFVPGNVGIAPGVQLLGAVELQRNDGPWTVPEGLHKTNAVLTLTSLSAEWHRRTAAGATRVAAFAIDYGLSLFSNFTYALERPADGDQFSQQDQQTNLRVVRKLWRGAELTLDVFNLFDRQLNDIEYFYESRLKSEVAPVADRHVHPAEPRSVRVTLKVAF